MANKVVEKHMQKLFEKLLYENHAQSNVQADRLTKIVEIHEEIKEKFPEAWNLVLKLSDAESEYLAEQERIVFELTTHLNRAFLPLMNVDFKNLGGGGVKRG